MELNETTIHVQNCGFYDEEEGMDLEGLPPFAQADSCNTEPTEPDDCDERKSSAEEWYCDLKSLL